MSEGSAAPEPIADPAEFARAYAGVAPALQVWASVRIRPRLRAFCEPEDLLQEIWVRAFAIRDRFAPERMAFRRWLFRIAKNVLLEVSRKARYAGRVTNPEGRTSRLFALDNAPDLATSITRQVARDDSLRRFHQRVEQLDEDDRDLFLHIGLEGLDYGEVAERFDLNRETVKKRWQRLRARLEAQGLPKTLVE